MNLSVFNTMVSSTLRRGTSLDTQIPTQVAMAVQWIERNYNFKYMETFKLGLIKGPQVGPPAMPGQRQLFMPGALVKSWIFFRIVQNDGSYAYLNKVEPKDLNLVSSTANTLIANTIPSGTTTFIIMPGNFFQVGLSTIVLDAIPSQDFNTEAMFYGYSSWPVDPSTYPVGSLPGNIPATSFDHPLLDIATDLLLAQTQLQCAVNLMKDLRMMAAYKELRDEAINTMTRAEDETKYGGEDISMTYNPQWDWGQLNSAASLGFAGPNRG